MNGNMMNNNCGCGNNGRMQSGGMFGCGNNRNMQANNGCGNNRGGRMNNGACSGNNGNVSSNKTCGCGTNGNFSSNNGRGNNGNSSSNNGCGCGNNGNSSSNNGRGYGNSGNSSSNNGGGCGSSSSCDSAMLQLSQQLMNMSEQQLLLWLSQVSFAMYDATLYLDTHPTDSCALEYFQTMRNKRKAAMDIYARKFGPLLLDNSGDGCNWDWGAMPLPWE